MPSAASDPQPGLSSVELKTMTVPHTYSSLGDQAFTVAALHVWYSLPLSLCSLHTQLR